MAQTISSDEERERRIELIGNYRLKTGASTRKIAEVFSNSYFKISNATVADYLERYKQMHPEVKDIIAGQTNQKIPSSIEKDEVRIRTLKVAKLIKEGFTIEEISKSLNEQYWVIYMDIKNRLPRLDKNLSEEIDMILKERSLQNLINQNGQKK